MLGKYLNAQIKECFIQEKKNTADRIFGNNLNQIKAHTTT